VAGNARILTVKILTDASGAGSGLNAAAATYGKFAAALGTKSQSAGVQVGNKLVNGIDKVLVTGLKVTAGAAAIVAGTALAAGFSRLNAIDQATAKLNGLGHSAATVDKIMSNALASVKGTAFGLGEAASTAASVVAAGVKPGKQLESVLKTVADSATIAGVSMDDMGSIFAKVAAKNKVQGDVINQLTTAGIPVLQLLASHYGITAEAASAMVTRGEVDFDNFAAAMKAGMGGAALESGKTFTGAWNNTIAALGRIGANLLEPLFVGAKDGLQGIPALLEPVEEKAKQVAQSLVLVAQWVQRNGTLLRNLGIIAGVVVGLLLTFRLVVAVMSAYRAVMLVVQAAQVGYAAATYGTVAASYAGAASTTAQNVALLAGKAAWIAVAVAQKVATAAQWLFNVAVSANPIALIIIAIIALVAVFVLLWTKCEGFRNFFIGMWAVLQAAAGAVASFFQSVWLAAVALVQNRIASWVAVAVAVINGIRATVAAVTSFFSSAWTSAVSASQSVFNTFRTIVTNVFNAILAPINAVRSAIEHVLGVARSVAGAIGGILGFSAGSAYSYPATLMAPTAMHSVAYHRAAPRVARGGFGGLGGGGDTYVIQVSGGLDSADTIARRIEDTVSRRSRRTGGVDLPRRS
jgi:tape measure domain-containing protein